MMMSNKKKALLFSIGTLLIVAAIIGYNMYNKGPVDVGAARGIEATPDELYAFYTTDSSAAFKKFDNKVLKVTGEVSDVSKNTEDQQVIILKTANAGGNINCTMENASDIKPGDTVTIKGICSGIGQGDPDLGILGDVYLIRSIASAE